MLVLNLHTPGNSFGRDLAVPYIHVHIDDC